MAGFDKSVKQGLLAGVGLAEPLRVPLDPEAKRCVRLFQRLDETVLAEGGNFQPRSHPAGCLMGLAVDQNGGPCFKISASRVPRRTVTVWILAQ